MKLSRIVIAVAAAIVLALCLAACAHKQYFEWDEQLRLRKAFYNEGFDPAWSAGAGKTLDLHPEVNGLTL